MPWTNVNNLTTKKRAVQLLSLVPTVGQKETKILILLGEVGLALKEF